MTTTATFARRVKFYDARRHFQNGGTVVVSENGTTAELLVTEATTVHTRDTTTWEYLAGQVAMWRSRYPNQRFYVVE